MRTLRLGVVGVLLLLGLTLAFGLLGQASGVPPIRIPDLAGLETPSPDAKGELAQARVLLDIPDYPGAVQRLDRALDLCPDYASAHFFRALAHEQLGQLEEAVADYDRAIELAPRCPHLHPNLVCDRLEFHPNSLYLSRGRVRHRMGDHRGAIADFDLALALDGTAAGYAYYHRGIAYLALGETARGTADLEQALDSIPADETVVGAIRRRLAEAKAGS